MNIYVHLKEKFASGEYDGLALKKICEDLKVKTTFEKNAVKDVLTALENDGVICYKSGIFINSEKCGLIKGVIRGNERRFAFFTPDSGGEDLFIPPKFVHGALDKDVVLVMKTGGGKNSDEAEVVKILSRGVKEVIGDFIKKRERCLVYSSNRNFGAAVYIPHNFTLKAKNGDKVRAEIISYTEGGPEGRVVEILGKSGELETEENAIIAAFGLKEKFPEEVLREERKTPDKVFPAQLAGREDFTKRLIITIDGDDSRDFDDAVEVTKLENGNYRLGVHIADVTEYVPRRSALDREAFERGTSVYFPDRVLPMLPKRLSDGICSLNEGEIRLTLSCISEISPDGNVVDRRIVKSAIRSAHRMTYKQVQGILEGDKQLIKRFNDVVEMIAHMRELQKILSRVRDGRGAVNIETSEADITIKDGEIKLGARGESDAYKIIEEFMVLTNEIVAEFAFYSEIPFVYRIHEKPTAEKAEFFVNFIRLFGLNVKWKTENPRPSDYAAILNSEKDKYYFPLVNKVMLRSMRKAEYSEENKGHFGLASKCYCHFTSPIRRYPDLAIHRIIKETIDGNIEKLNDLYGDFMSLAAGRSSEAERRAEEAEREVDELYKTAYMKNYVGLEFDGVISGVTQNGIYTELENTVEGFTGVEDLPRGNYVFDESTFTLSAGKRKSYSLGERVKVGVLFADIAERRVRFLILGKIA